MATVEKFKNKKTESLGLWWNKKFDCWQSNAMDISKLSYFTGNVRIILRRNKYWKKDTNRPAWTIRIVSSDVDMAKEVEIEEAGIKKRESQMLYTPSQVIEFLHELEYGYSIDDLEAEVMHGYRCSWGVLDDD